MRNLFSSWQKSVQRIHAMRAEFARRSDSELRGEVERAKSVEALVALGAVAASRVLGQEMFDVQLRGALALAAGKIAEMKTGEGKTLAAVPAVAWYARERKGVHVMTVNDYLARRDAAWMGDIYRLLGFSVGFVQQGMSYAERRAAYNCDITYATANEIGFDVLRDRLALRQGEQVHRPFHAAVIDEADSILIDEARIPLVIAGGDSAESGLALAADRVVRPFQPGVHYTVDVGNHNVALTDSGIRAVEESFACGNLFEDRNLILHTAVQDSLHAHALLRRDVDYVVKEGAIELVDEFKGRIALDRRWPAGLHAAVEVKEGVAAKSQGMVLGSTSLQHLVALYPYVCGMTGTAATQSIEFLRIYDLKVEEIPTNRPVIRVDHPDVVFKTRDEKERAVVEEIRRVHATGQPILLCTASVEESERYSGMLGGGGVEGPAELPEARPDLFRPSGAGFSPGGSQGLRPGLFSCAPSGLPEVARSAENLKEQNTTNVMVHRVLNARNDEAEAGIIAEAGQRGAVTVSTNMAGRGTDIRLGEGVAELGGLYVIGTNKNESRRIDNQLRGRSGRQGDPGCSRFFVSLEDDLMVKYRDLDPRYWEDPDTIQRLVEGQHLDARNFLHGYEVPIEGQRNRIHTWRQSVLDGTLPCRSELERVVTLRTIDEMWADYLAQVSEFRSGLPWLSFATSPPLFLSLGRRDPHWDYLRQIDEWFPALEAAMPEEIERRVAEVTSSGVAPMERGAVWTYLTTDQPFGDWKTKMMQGLKKKWDKGELL